MRRRDFIRSVLGVPVAITAASLGIAAAPRVAWPELKTIALSPWQEEMLRAIHDVHVYGTGVMRVPHGDGTSSRVTATEIEARHNEKLRQLQPVIDKMQSDWLVHWDEVAARVLVRRS